VDDDHLLIVATDRISAFDAVMPNGVPGKGVILTQMSLFWFDLMADIVSNHLVSGDVEDVDGLTSDEKQLLKGRIMLARKADRLDAECVARGYMAGSGWKDYQNTCEICGVPLPEGLTESERLPEVIFTPATKADSGHDENIPFETMSEIVGDERAVEMRSATLDLYETGRSFAEKRGIIIADTKFEFGVIDGELALIDEVLSPDSSRFWPADEYEPGRPQASFDKQFVRDYLETLSWDKNPPAPSLPDEIVEKTLGKYREAQMMLTGSHS
jgi:phosphoribosylaminoimidazole-succinocarboxamide synthase